MTGSLKSNFVNVENFYTQMWQIPTKETCLIPTSKWVIEAPQELKKMYSRFQEEKKLRVRCAEVFCSFWNPFVKSRSFVLLKTKLLTPKSKMKNLKSALNFHEYRTVWSYLVFSLRNMYFCGRGSLNFEWSNWMIFTHKILVSLQK